MRRRAQAARRSPRRLFPSRCARPRKGLVVPRFRCGDAAQNRGLPADVAQAFFNRHCANVLDAFVRSVRRQILFCLLRGTAIPPTAKRVPRRDRHHEDLNHPLVADAEASRTPTSARAARMLTVSRHGKPHAFSSVGRWPGNRRRKRRRRPDVGFRRRTS